MPAEKVKFYHEQLKKNSMFSYALYRAPMFLASSKSLRKATEVLGWNTNPAPDEVPIIFVIHIDGARKTRQVNYL
eukprot:6932590-Karenia_brevis.AAC.1